MRTELVDEVDGRVWLYRVMDDNLSPWQVTVVAEEEGFRVHVEGHVLSGQWDTPEDGLDAGVRYIAGEDNP